MTTETPAAPTRRRAADTTPQPTPPVLPTPEEASEAVQVAEALEPEPTDPMAGFLVAEEVSLDRMKILVYGESGAGKTHFGSGVDGVVVLSMEPQGQATIRASNPKALIWPARNMPSVRTFFTKAMDGATFPKLGIKTIVIDSVTELQQLVIEEILAEKKKNNKVAKDGAPELAIADWGIIASKLRNVLKTLRDLPYHVVILALAEPVTEEDTGIRRLYPKLSGSMQSALPSFVNVVGFIFNGKAGRAVATSGSDKHLLKSYGPLNGVLQADLREWLKALETNVPPLANVPTPNQTQAKPGTTRKAE